MQVYFGNYSLFFLVYFKLSDMSIQGFGVSQILNVSNQLNILIVFRITACSKQNIFSGCTHNSICSSLRVFLCYDAIPLIRATTLRQTCNFFFTFQNRYVRFLIPWHIFISLRFSMRRLFLHSTIPCDASLTFLFLFAVSSFTFLHLEIPFPISFPFLAAYLHPERQNSRCSLLRKTYVRQN